MKMTVAAADLAGHERVERHEPHGIILDDVLHESTGAREVRMVGERGRERVAIVVVARDEVDRHGERRQQVVQAAVLPGASRVDEIAGRQHDVGARPQSEQMRDGAREVGRRVHAPVREDAFGPDVHVGDLGDDHGIRIVPGAPGGERIASP